MVERALRIDDFALSLDLIFFASAATAIVFSLRDRAAERAPFGDFSGLLLVSVTGMFVLASATNLVTLFLGIELLSIPLYVLCALDVRRPTSLESGLKYLVVGSIGSATLLYGLAMIYGATASTDFAAIAAAVSKSSIGGDPLLLTGLGLAAVGLAFKASVAPFHQWTPDVYEGAPTPVTSFMAVATKVAAFAIIVRFFEQALLPVQADWDAALAALAVVSIVVGNVAALGQDSLKRMLAYSGVAQAGYILVGVIAGTQLGVRAVVFYLCAYALMNVAAFAVVIVRERETPLGDDISAVAGIGRSQPAAGLDADAQHAVAGRLPGDGRLLRQVLPDRGGRQRRLHLARHRDRDRLDDLAGATTCGSSRRSGCDRNRPACRRSPAARAEADADPPDGRRLAHARRRDRRRALRGGGAVLRHHPQPAAEFRRRTRPSSLPGWARRA